MQLFGIVVVTVLLSVRFTLIAVFEETSFRLYLAAFETMGGRRKTERWIKQLTADEVIFSLQVNCVAVLCLSHAILNDCSDAWFSFAC